MANVGCFIMGIVLTLFALHVFGGVRVDVYIPYYPDDEDGDEPPARRPA